MPSHIARVPAHTLDTVSKSRGNVLALHTKPTLFQCHAPRGALQFEPRGKGIATSLYAQHILTPDTLGTLSPINLGAEPHASRR